MSDKARLPHPWTVVRLEDVAHLQLGKMLDKARPKGSPHQYLRNINVRWDAVDTTDLLSMAFDDDELERFSIRDGDLLVCEGGEPGRAAVWKGGPTDLRFQKALHRVRFLGGVSGRWAMYQLMLDASTGVLSRGFTGSTIAHLPREKLAEYQLRLAPGAEQDRIVDAVDSYVSRLDAAVTTLEAAQKKLKAYRASVLKAAVEGRLVPTEAAFARAEKRDFEPADVLLKRILSERRRRWEENELAKLKAAGKSPKDDKWKAKYVEPKVPDTKDLPKLPEGWCWAAVGQLTRAVRDGPHFSPKYSDSDDAIPFITGGNVRPNGVDFDRAKRISPALHAEFCKRVRPEVGDVLYTKGGTTGIARVNTYDRDFSVWVHVAVLKLVGLIQPFYLQHALNSPFCYAQAQRLTHGVGNQDLGLTRMIHIALPLAPFSEQQRIVDEVDRLLSAGDASSALLATAQGRTDRVRQSVLKWAFEGRLVDQNPNDEPASKLLERIRAERANGKNPKSTGRARKSK